MSANAPTARTTAKAVDSIQERIVNYACGFDYRDVTPEAIHAAMMRVIDTLGALMGGFFMEPCVIARNLAAQMPNAHGATIIGTRIKTTPDMAAFANGTAARSTEMTDNYQWPGSFGGHTSDVVMPSLSVAEYAHKSGREFIAGVVLGYEVYARVSDVFHNMGFDHPNFSCLANAVVAGKLLGLSADQIGHAIAMAIVPNNALRVARIGHLSMWKVTASGQAARGGVFAALLARAGMEGPHLPFEGKSGWCDHVALERFSLNTMGGHGTSFKIGDTSLKMRPVSGILIPALVACEEIGALNIQDIKQITVEVNKKTLDFSAIGDHHWHPDSQESADHSAPYVVAVTLMDGKLTAASFNDAHLANPQLHALLQRIKVIENAQFTLASERKPVEHRSRVTVVMADGKQHIVESDGGKDNLSPRKSDAQIEGKFLALTEDLLGTKHVRALLDRLWRLEDMEDVAAIAPEFVLA